MEPKPFWRFESRHKLVAAVGLLIIHSKELYSLEFNCVVFFKMDKSSKVVTFNEPLEIEDLEISMNQGQFEETILL